MNSKEVRDALASIWPDSKYLHIYEAPLDPMRQANKIDVLVIACWKSLGYELDAVEVKVSYWDWKKEIESVRYHVGNKKHYLRRQAIKSGQPVVRIVTEDLSKSQEWRKYAHRFWIAAPSSLAERIQPELPAGWGLLSVSDSNTVQVLVKPKKTIPKPLPWPFVIGLLRTAVNAGAQVIARAEQRGRDEAKRTAQLRGTTAGQAPRYR